MNGAAIQHATLHFWLDQKHAKIPGKDPNPTFCWSLYTAFMCQMRTLITESE